MAELTFFPKPLRALLAAIFAAATIVYSIVWMYSVNKPPSMPMVELGYDTNYLQFRRCQIVTSVYPASPAERAGLKAGDCILAINGTPLDSAFALFNLYSRAHPGSAAALVVERPNAPSLLLLHATFRARRLPSHEVKATERVLLGVLNFYPLPFLIVGLAVLFLRLDDRNAWLLALMFAGFIAVPFPPDNFNTAGRFLGTAARTYRAIFDSLTGSFFYFFFAVFPARSPLDRRWPWLKWAGFAIAPVFILPGLVAGDPRSPAFLINLAGFSAATTIRLTYLYSFTILGLIALVSTRFAQSTPADARRKARVILLGTLVGVVPVLIDSAAAAFLRLHPPFVVDAVIVILLFLFPLSFAYAVVKHRVLEIPVLLKRSARYVLVKRGFVLGSILFTVAALSIFFTVSTRYVHMESNVALPAGMGLGILAFIIVTRANSFVSGRVIRRIDRAFFRDAYDAGQVMENLAYKSRAATRREELAALLESEISQAVHPAFVAVYLETSGGRLGLERDGAGSAQTAGAPDLNSVLPSDAGLLRELAQRAGPMELAGPEDRKRVTDSIFGPQEPECLVPLLAGDGHLTGVIALGARRSEEPYSREDKRLLASVASQAALAFESIRRGEQIAERMEAERRTQQEMEFAREVQARLLPQNLPKLRTLEYAGVCVPARQIGGDYYDFLELRPGRVALVLADIAGKGVSGALLMANLQANLRSQYALALENLERLLASVNRLFYDNTAENSYATLFFADYDDATRRVRYVNCGHLAPLILRGATGLSTDPPRPIQRLSATATVLGLFPHWECSVEEIQLSPGDTLVLYTDGVTEAENAQGEEFGEPRLIKTLLDSSRIASAEIIGNVVQSVRRFSPGEQFDDITLVVGQCRA